MRLFEQVTKWMDIQAHKHEFGEDYVKNNVNAMSNYELLKAISDAFDEIQSIQDDYSFPEITDNPNL
jgi:hypothetical protein